MGKLGKNIVFILLIIALSSILCACNAIGPNNTETISGQSKTAINREDFIWHSNFNNVLIGINNNNVEKIIIPENCEEIIGGPFSHCYKLKELSTPVIHPIESPYPITLSDYFAGNSDFNCPTLDKVTITKGNIPSNYFGDGVTGNIFLITKIFISKGITRIESEGLIGCLTLQDLYLPNSIEYIGASAIRVTAKNTNVNIHYNGTKEEWLAIKKENTWCDVFNGTLTIICTDGKIA